MGTPSGPHPTPTPHRAQAPRRFCAHQGCGEKVSSGHCQKHQTAKRATETRFTKGKYGRPWRRAVAEWIAEDPDTRAFCAQCRQEGTTTIGEETDHIIPHRGNDALFWDRTNWQRLCRHHHSSKTATEVGFR